MTAVETSPDLRHARVFVSVLGDAGRAQALARGPAVGARLPAARASPRELRLKHTPTLEFVYDDTRRARRCASSELIDREASAREHAQRRHRPRASRCSTSCATASASCSITHEHPDGDALGSLVAMQQRAAARWARTPSSFMARRRVPAALRVPLPRAATARQRRCPTDVDERTVDLPRLRQHRPQPGRASSSTPRAILNIDHHHDNTRFGTVNHVVPEASCTAEIVWDLMRGARRRADASRSPRRSTSASSPTPAGSCTRTPARART